MTALSILTESRGRPAKFHALDHVFKNEVKHVFGNISETHATPYINWIPDDGSERKVPRNDQGGICKCCHPLTDAAFSEGSGEHPEVPVSSVRLIRIIGNIVVKCTHETIAADSKDTPVMFSLWLLRACSCDVHRKLSPPRPDFYKQNVSNVRVYIKRFTPEMSFSARTSFVSHMDTW
jgi:hypothetical protein